MKNMPCGGVTFTCAPSASSSDATIGPTAATTMRQVCIAAGSAGYIANPANLRSARKGDRVELAGSHIVDDSEHPLIVGFRDVDIGKYRIWNGPDSFDETTSRRFGLPGLS